MLRLELRRHWGRIVLCLAVLWAVAYWFISVAVSPVLLSNPPIYLYGFPFQVARVHRGVIEQLHLGGLVLNALFFGGVLVAVSLPFVLRWRPRPGRCAKCGYDVSRSGSVCPECGGGV